MEIEVIKQFTDKDSRKLHKAGEVLKYSDKRGKFLVDKGFAQEVKKSFEENTSKELNKK